MLFFGVVLALLVMSRRLEHVFWTNWGWVQFGHAFAAQETTSPFSVLQLEQHEPVAASGALPFFERGHDAGRVGMGYTEMYNGHPQQAIPFLHSFDKDRSLLPTVALGSAYYQSGDVTSALGVWKTIGARDPALLAQLGNWLRQQGQWNNHPERWDQGILLMQSALPFLSQPKDKLFVLDALAETFKWKRDFPTAIQYAQMALDLAADKSARYTTLAEIYMNVDQVVMADLASEQALRLDPKNVRALVVRSEVLLARCQLDEASALLNHALPRVKDGTELWTRSKIALGMVKWYAGEYTQAHQIWATLRKVEPQADSVRDLYAQLEANKIATTCAPRQTAEQN